MDYDKNQADNVHKRMRGRDRTQETQLQSKGFATASVVLLTRVNSQIIQRQRRMNLTVCQTEMLQGYLLTFYTYVICIARSGIQFVWEQRNH
jgi:hypothetical protein